MVQRPPFDRNNPPPPGGFNPRFSDGQERPGPDPRYDQRQDQRQDRRSAEPDPFDRGREATSAGGGRGPRPGGPNRWMLIVGGLLLLGAILFGLSLTRSGPGSDALGNNSEGTDEEVAVADPEARCATPATYDLIKRELFRQAAVTRGSDQAAFDQLSGYSALRVTKPVLREQDAGLERVSCTADVALDLPPGVQVVGGRRTLTASLGYNLQPAADSSGDVVTLNGAEGIVVPLATLARTGSAAPATTDGTQPLPEPVEPGGVVPPVGPVNPAPPAPEPVDTTPDRAPPATEPAAAARPSFSCARARTRGEIAVCNSSELAALDRQMASFYGTAYRGADREAKRLLEQTRSRFLTYRDRCRNDACVADAYRGRISEIRDIADGRWRGQ
ncbi:uncharacterized protein YecT (DUF1311 family) [Sphingomonas kaistensis]|uniref:Uncharacterized protein YecT (DUF1311 family) n=1 Tax=Sphingomonas kaistensis TaxID=298708 RepID=A0A7X5Y738_9SPHN|nr:hypothetical protein [Sphingomonas kaistensis]NJC06241.1 uncharacterized protein YecT (DUF1311 family) [Sphingomonas kaistensis]